MKRFQARRGGGEWTRNTLKNTFGLQADVCAACNSFVTYGVNEAPPDACHHCGAIIIREKCAHGRCREAFPDPFIFRQGGYDECGKPAVACGIENHWGQCEQHLPEDEST